MSVLLEICVDSLAGIAAAAGGGADRVELCAALELGGLTPSAALIDAAVAGGLPVHVLVRPRAGGFVLAQGETALIVRDIRAAIARGAAGVVVGALTAGGALDVPALAAFRAAAGDATLVLHRAIDLSTDPVAAVETACSIGIDKVLSSGGANSARAGAPMLAEMVAAAAGRLSVIAGGGVRPETVAALVASTGVDEVHASASIPAPPASAPETALGFAALPQRITDRRLVAALRDALSRGLTPA